LSPRNVRSRDLEPRPSLLRFLRKQPTQSRSRALVEALIDAFDELLRRTRNEDEVTLEALVARAGVGIGSFYEYFSGKDALIGTLVEKATVENFEVLLARMDASGADLEAKLRTVTSAVAEAYVRHPARTRMLLTGIGRHGLLPMVSRERDRFACEVAARLRPYAPHEPLEVLERTVVLACDACMGIATGEIHRDGETDIARAGDELFTICMRLLEARHDLVR
jgi:AcrR family transcriptional regulator